MNPRSLVLCLVTALVAAVHPPAARGSDPELKHTVVLLIRHAEKSETTDGLTPAGVARANAYPAYFQNFKLQGEPLKLDAIFAAGDSEKSHRPRITVEPTATAFGLAVNSGYKNSHYQELADDLKAHYGGKHVLICWHHGDMPELLRALGADPVTLLPGGTWPGDQYDWLIELRYDGSGRLKSSRRISEGLTGSR